MSHKILEQIQELINVSDLEGLIYKLPDQSVIEKYQTDIGIIFNNETREYFANIPYIAFNGFEPLLLTNDPEIWLDLASATKEAHQLGVPKDWLPILESNSDYYCVRPDGKVAFWSHDGQTDETWDNIATWIHDVWIGGQ